MKINQSIIMFSSDSGSSSGSGGGGSSGGGAGSSGGTGGGGGSSGPKGSPGSGGSPSPGGSPSGSPSSGSSSGAIAPSISPSDDQAVIIDSSGKTVTLTASGGQCVPPPDPNKKLNWAPNGSLEYVWLYDTLQGSPSPAGKGASLALNRDKEGKTSVTVKAQQKWKAKNNTSATTSTQASAAVKVNVQKPTSIQFVSSAPAEPYGAAYKWKLFDGSDEPIKNLDCTLTETFTGSTTFTHNIPNATFPEKSGAATDKGSDDEGVLTDTPVGLNKDQLKLFAMQNNTNYTATTTVDHTYNEIQLPDGTKFTVTTHQTQTVTQKVTPIYSTFGNTQVITDVTVETTATDPQ